MEDSLRLVLLNLGANQDALVGEFGSKKLQEYVYQSQGGHHSGVIG
jgi:hypothetical protein